VKDYSQECLPGGTLGEKVLEDKNAVAVKNHNKGNCKCKTCKAKLNDEGNPEIGSVACDSCNGDDCSIPEGGPGKCKDGTCVPVDETKVEEAAEGGSESPTAPSMPKCEDLPKDCDCFNVGTCGLGGSTQYNEDGDGSCNHIPSKPKCCCKP